MTTYYAIGYIVETKAKISLRLSEPVEKLISGQMLSESVSTYNKTEVLYSKILVPKIKEFIVSYDNKLKMEANKIDKILELWDVVGG